MKSLFGKCVKKSLGIIMMFVMLFSLAGCDSKAKKEAIVPEKEQTQKNPDTKTLVVYFSWSGHTKKVADKIKKETNADVFRIVTKEVYPDNYYDTLDVAKKELDEDARPELTTTINNLDQYDTIFVGYPNWWQNMPMAMYTFFDEYDFKGKIIIPFCTHGGSGLSDTVNIIKKEEPNAKVLEGLAIQDNNLNNCDKDITNWLNKLNMEK